VTGSGSADGEGALEPFVVALGAPIVAFLALLVGAALVRGRGDAALLAVWLGCCGVCVGGEAWAFALGARLRRRGAPRREAKALVVMVVAALLAASALVAAALAWFVVRLAGVD
jgi:phosphate/sulfate permease